MPQPDDDWRCGYCGAHFPVPSMARDHERQHDDEDTDPVPHSSP